MFIILAHGGMVPHLHAESVVGLLVLVLAMFVVVVVGRKGAR